MKYLKYNLLLVSVIITLISCSEVITIDVPAEEPRLVIEASIDWEKGTLGNEQLIKLSMTTPYFDENTDSPVTGASVKVTNNVDHSEYIFTDQNDGNYLNSNFVPIISQSYSLEVIHDNEVYIANETLMSVTDIVSAIQEIKEVDGEDHLGIYISFNDLEFEENYYIIRIQNTEREIPYLDYFSDEFFNGNLIELFYYQEDFNENSNLSDFVEGDVIDINLFGISKQYYNYMELLINQTSDGGDVFGAIPVTLRGNCINQTNQNNYPLGYFRLNQVDKMSYTFE